MLVLSQPMHSLLWTCSSRSTSAYSDGEQQDRSAYHGGKVELEGAYNDVSCISEYHLTVNSFSHNNDINQPHLHLQRTEFVQDAKYSEHNTTV